MRPLLLPMLALLGCASTVTPNATPTDAAVSLDSPPPPDVVAPSDGGPLVTDDCARGSWCWERPLPSGERIADAQAISPTEVVFATVGGTLARWDGTRWRTVILQLPAQVRSVWARRSDEVFLLCVSDNAPGGVQQSWLVRVRGDVPTVLGGPVMGFASRLAGTGPDDLWSLGNRGMLHWNGTTWRAVEGPGDVLLSGLHVRGPSDMLVLENWGSGSGTGRLHRFDGTTWTLLTSFEGLRVRVEAPLVVLDGALYLRAWDSGASRPRIVRYDLARGESELIAPPPVDGGVDLHTDGTSLWATYANRVWRRVGGQWQAQPTNSLGFGARILGAGQDVWLFGNVVARLRAGQWESFSSPLDGAAGFWRDRDPSPALVTFRPGGLATQNVMSRGVWTVSPMLDGAPAEGWTADGDNGGWFAASTGAVHVVNRRPMATISWPAGGRRQGPLGAWGASLWAVSERGIERYRDQVWAEPVTLPRIPEAPGQTPQVRALHGVGPDVAVFSTELVTGDKQVYVNVYALRGAVAAPVSALRGVFGSSAEAVVAGALPAVWVAFGGLRFWDGNGVRVVEPEVTPLDLHVLSDRRVVGTDGARVYVWTADGRRASTLPIPQMTDLHWSQVRGDTNGVIRVASGDAVLRYTP